MAPYRNTVIGNYCLEAVGGTDLYQFPSSATACICPFCLFAFSSSFLQPNSASPFIISIDEGFLWSAS